jgi:hypothetical protein
MFNRPPLLLVALPKIDPPKAEAVERFGWFGEKLRVKQPFLMSNARGDEFISQKKTVRQYLADFVYPQD